MSYIQAHANTPVQPVNLSACKQVRPMQTLFLLNGYKIDTSMLHKIIIAIITQTATILK